MNRPRIEGRLVRHRREVDRQDQRPDECDREHPAEVVDRLGALVHVAGHEPERHHERDHRQRQGDQEDRAPPVVLEQDAGASGPSEAIAPPVAAQSAIDFVRAGPDQSAVISASVVG